MSSGDRSPRGRSGGRRASVGPSEFPPANGSTKGSLRQPGGDGGMAGGGNGGSNAGDVGSWGGG